MEPNINNIDFEHLISCCVKKVWLNCEFVKPCYDTLSLFGYLEGLFDDERMSIDFYTKICGVLEDLGYKSSSRVETV